MEFTKPVAHLYVKLLSVTALNDAAIISTLRPHRLTLRLDKSASDQMNASVQQMGTCRCGDVNK